MQTPLEVLTPINMERKFSSLAREKKGLETLYIIRFKKKNIGVLEGVVFTALHTNFTFMNTRKKKIHWRCPSGRATTLWKGTTLWGKDPSSSSSSNSST